MWGLPRPASRDGIYMADICTEHRATLPRKRSGEGGEVGGGTGGGEDRREHPPVESREAQWTGRGPPPALSSRGAVSMKSKLPARVGRPTTQKRKTPQPSAPVPRQYIYGGPIRQFHWWRHRVASPASTTSSSAYPSSPPSRIDLRGGGAAICGGRSASRRSRAGSLLSAGAWLVERPLRPGAEPSIHAQHIGGARAE